MERKTKLLATEDVNSIDVSQFKPGYTPKRIATSDWIRPNYTIDQMSGTKFQVFNEVLDSKRVASVADAKKDNIMVFLEYATSPRTGNFGVIPLELTDVKFTVDILAADYEGDGGLSGLAIFGIVVGVIAVVGIGVWLFAIYRNRKAASPAQPQVQAQSQAPGQ